MEADDFRYYILGLIFFKYLSTKMELYATEIVALNHLKWRGLEVSTQEDAYLGAVKYAALDKLGFFYYRPSCLQSWQHWVIQGEITILF